MWTCSYDTLLPFRQRASSLVTAAEKFRHQLYRQRICIEFDRYTVGGENSTTYNLIQALDAPPTAIRHQSKR